MKEFKRVQVGYEWPVSKEIDIKEYRSIGGFNLIVTADTNELIIVGNSVFNLSTAPVTGVTLTPMTKDAYLNNTHNPNNVPEEFWVQNVYDLKDDAVYIEVSYDGRCWLFEKYDDAANFSALFTKFKIEGLQQKMRVDIAVIEEDEC